MTKQQLGWQSFQLQKASEVEDLVPTVDEKIAMRLRSRPWQVFGFVALLGGTGVMLWLNFKAGDPAWFQNGSMFLLTAAMGASVLRQNDAIKKLQSLRDEMRTAPFHELDFETPEAAAAFAAALSRRFDEDATDAPTDMDLIEVSAVRRGERALLYLSDAALDMTSEIPMPPSREILANELPGGRRTIIAGPSDSLSVDDVLGKLASSLTPQIGA